MEGREGPFMVVMGKWILINKTKLIVTFKLFYLIFYNCFEANFESEWLYCFYDDYPSMNWPLGDTDLDVILSLMIDILSFVLLVTRPNTRQSSRGWLGRSSNAKTAQNSKMWRTDGRTDRHTDLPTDTARCRVACPRLKITDSLLNLFIENQT